MNFIVFSTYYFLIPISVIGYGLLFDTSFHTHKKKINLGYAGLLGLSIIIIYSYISSFFIAHNIIHNSFVIFIGFCLFFLKLKKNFKTNQKEFFLFLLLFGILFISAFAYKTHDDFPFYHFNYTLFLTERASVFGSGAFNHGFRTPSSLFYINSIFYLPYIKYYSFHMAAIIIMGFSNFILIEKLKNTLNKKNHNFITYFSLLIFIFINVVFYRIAEHGTDRSAQILIFILVIELLLLINLDNLNFYKIKFQKILLLTGMIISLKAFYIFYIIFVIYLIFFLIRKIKFKKIIHQNLLYFFLLGTLIVLVILSNLQNSACLLYPVSFTCLSSLPWSISQEEISYMSTYYEFWAKGGAGPNFKVFLDPEVYIKNFNWIDNWLKVYFLEKGLNTLIGLFFISFVTFLFFYSKKKNIKKKNTYKFILFLFFVLFIEWFLKHPTLRYGGFCLLAILIFLPSSLILQCFYQLQFKKRIISLILITFLIFFSRNAYRIFTEIKKYNYQPVKQTFYYVNTLNKENYFVINNTINKLINQFEQCKKNKIKIINSCYDLNKKMGLFYDKYYFKKN